MALSDPQSVDIGKGATSLPRTSTSGSSSVYTSADGLLRLTLSTSSGKRKRQTIRLDVNEIAPDPFRPEENREISMSVYMVIDRPLTGFSNTVTLEAILGLLAQAAAGTDAVWKKLLGGES